MNQKLVRVGSVFISSILLACPNVAISEGSEKIEPYQIEGPLVEITPSGDIILFVKRDGSFSNTPIRLWKFWYLGSGEGYVVQPSNNVKCTILYEIEGKRVGDCEFEYIPPTPDGIEGPGNQIISIRELLWWHGDAILGCSTENLRNSPIRTTERDYNCEKEQYDGSRNIPDSQY